MALQSYEDGATHAQNHHKFNHQQAQQAHCSVFPIQGAPDQAWYPANWSQPFKQSGTHEYLLDHSAFNSSGLPTPPATGRQVHFQDNFCHFGPFNNQPMHQTQFGQQQNTMHNLLTRNNMCAPSTFALDTPAASDCDFHESNDDTDASAYQPSLHDTSNSPIIESLDASSILFITDKEVEQLSPTIAPKSTRGRATRSSSTPLPSVRRTRKVSQAIRVSYLPEKMSNKRSRTAPALPTTSPCRAHKRRKPAEDPENHKIMKLRTKDLLSWADIATIMNKARIDRGEEPSFTEAAVYGRFVRNGPRVAEATGENDFDPKDWMHMKKTGTISGNDGELRAGRSINRTGKKMAPGEAEENEFLAHVVSEVQEDMWDLVAERMERQLGGEWDAQKCKTRWERH